MAVTKITDAEFEETLQKNPKVVVKFYADWCGSCKLLGPKFRRLSEEEGLNEVTFLDVNAEENPEIRQKVGVNNLPYIATFKNGELQTGDAIAKIDTIRKMVENL